MKKEQLKELMQEAYEMGRDSATNGSNTTNMHDGYFKNNKVADEWCRGADDARQEIGKIEAIEIAKIELEAQQDQAEANLIEVGLNARVEQEAEQAEQDNKLGGSESIATKEERLKAFKNSFGIGAKQVLYALLSSSRSEWRDNTLKRFNDTHSELKGPVCISIMQIADALVDAYLNEVKKPKYLVSYDPVNDSPGRSLTA